MVIVVALCTTVGVAATRSVAPAAAGVEAPSRRPSRKVTTSPAASHTTPALRPAVTRLSMPGSTPTTAAQTPVTA